MNIKYKSGRIFFYSLLIITVNQINACKKESVQPITPAPSGNKPPVANAGSDQTITLPINAVTLDGSKSTDPDNNITGYVWRNISGPSGFTIANANAVQTQLNNLVQGVYIIELKVTDAGGLSSKDTVQVTVNAAVSSSTQVAFWTDEGSICLCTGDPIYISVNNTTQILDKYYYGPRVTTCEDNNAIRFNLMPGTYSWLAVRGKDTLRGSVNLNANSCVLQEINF